MSRQINNSYSTDPCQFGQQIAIETSFEEVVKALGLSREEYADSEELRVWVKRYKNLKYVPPTS